MNIGDIICERRKSIGLSQAELAERLRSEGFELTNQAVSKWEKGSTLPNARQFLALCSVLEIDDIAGLFSGGSGGGILAGLNAAGRKKVMEYIQLLHDSGKYELLPEAPIVPLRSLPLYTLPVSAGTGQFLDGEDYEMKEVGPEVDSRANFGVRISGDSMEPRFHDGQQVWVKQQRDLMTGEIGIFLYDGSAYLKQLMAVGSKLVLHSLNPAYDDIPILPTMPLRVLGKVLG